MQGALTRITASLCPLATGRPLVLDRMSFSSLASSHRWSTWSELTYTLYRKLFSVYMSAHIVQPLFIQTV